MYITQHLKKRPYEEVRSQSFHPALLLERKQVNNALHCYIYVLVMYIKFISQINLYARNVVISITQGITETYFDESRGDIVPLVLPTQLESEESESECEDESKADARQYFGKTQEAYDEDVDEFETEITYDRNNVWIDKAAYMVSKHPLNDLCVFILLNH